jgi:KDO2-lipid IV(A) lauroyltransferase
MASRTHALRWGLALPVLKSFASAAGVLSRAQLFACGRALGTVGFCLSRRERRRALAHLAQAFPGESEETRRSYARKCFENLAVGLFETLAMHRWPREKLRDLLVNPEVFDRALELRDTGHVFVTAHMGNWEMLAAMYVRYGGQLHVVGRRMERADFDSFLTTLRGASGVEILHRDRSARHMLRALRNGVSIGILPDQDIAAVDGLFVDFFGRPAYTPAAPARLSLAARVPLYVSLLLREGDRFRMTFEGPLDEGLHDLPREEAELRLTQAWTDTLEGWIRRYPDQWVWMHRRWRHTPEGFRARRGPRVARAAGGAAQ